MFEGIGWVFRCVKHDSRRKYISKQDGDIAVFLKRGGWLLGILIPQFASPQPPDLIVSFDSTLSGLDLEQYGEFFCELDTKCGSIARD